MMQTRLLTLALCLLTGCVAAPDVIRTDFTQNEGVYVLGYTTNVDIRRAMEDQLVQDLNARDIVAYASHHDLPDIGTTTREGVLAAANAKRTIAVIVINQVVPGEDGVIDNPLRVSPLHPDLQTFYEHTKTVEENYDADREVFAEVNAFLIDGQKTRLAWSGTTWSFVADGAGGAIRGISETVATELRKIRDEFRSN